jgi:hypothetical protein
MSDRLAISAGFSVMMMAAYVLFGQGAAREPLGPRTLSADTGIVEPAQALTRPGELLTSLR